MLILTDIRDKPTNPVYFVHIPKNAGTGMAGLGKKWMVSAGHAHPVVIGPRFGWNHVKHLRFAIFRDPWDRAVSLLEYARLNYPKKPEAMPQFAWTIEDTYLIDKVAMMRRFLKQLLAEKESGVIWKEIYNARQQITMMKSAPVDKKTLDRYHDNIVDWSKEGNRGMFIWKVLDDLGLGFNTEGEWCVDVVLRCHCLQQDLTIFRHLLGLPPIDIGVTNQSRRYQTKYYFDDGVRELFRNIYPDDIEFWDRIK